MLILEKENAFIIECQAQAEGSYFNNVVFRQASIFW